MVILGVFCCSPNPWSETMSTAESYVADLNLKALKDYGVKDPSILDINTGM